MSSPELELAQLVSDAVQKALREIMIGVVAEVRTFDAARMVATVQPLLQIGITEVRQEPSRPLTDIPVSLHWGGGYYIKPTYKPGDLVWLSFATHSIELALKGQYDQNTGRIFDRQAAVITHGLMPLGKGAAIPALQTEGFVIGNDKGDFLFSHDESGLRLEAPVVTIKTGTTEYVFSPATATSLVIGTHVHAETGATTGVPQ